MQINNYDFRQIHLFIFEINLKLVAHGAASGCFVIAANSSQPKRYRFAISATYSLQCCAKNKAFVFTTYF